MAEHGSDLGPKLGQLADGILDELLANGAEISLDQRIDALKAIGTLHLGLVKVRGKLKDDEDDSGVSIRDMRNRLKAVGDK